MALDLSQYLTRRERQFLPALVEPARNGVTCDLWVARVDNASFPESLLSKEEEERLARFRQEVDRARFLAGCAMARLFLADQLGIDQDKIEIDRTCPRCGEAHGKPRVTASNWQYSISHSGQYVAVAFCENVAVGIDIELDRAGRSPALWPAVLTATELKMLQALDRDEQDTAFLRYWTRKEAILKCIGVGLTMEPRLLEVTPPGAAPAIETWPEELGEYTPISLVDLGLLPGHVGALAFEGPCPRVRAFEVAPAG